MNITLHIKSEHLEIKQGYQDCPSLSEVLKRGQSTFNTIKENLPHPCHSCATIEVWKMLHSESDRTNACLALLYLYVDAYDIQICVDEDPNPEFTIDLEALLETLGVDTEQVQFLDIDSLTIYLPNMKVEYTDSITNGELVDAMACIGERAQDHLNCNCAGCILATLLCEIDEEGLTPTRVHQILGIYISANQLGPRPTSGDIVIRVNHLLGMIDEAKDREELAEALQGCVSEVLEDAAMEEKTGKTEH